jgi:hypothetical protein
MPLPPSPPMISFRHAIAPPLFFADRYAFSRRDASERQRMLSAKKRHGERWQRADGAAMLPLRERCWRAYALSCQRRARFSSAASAQR